jgi:hypothetical protein
MFDGDPFDSGTPKYSSPQDIYDALQEMAYGEESGILSEMFENVSWEGQDYYYTDNAAKLVERWGTLTNGCDMMWLMDVAAWQLTDGDANDFVYEALINEDLAKRIGFKKIFVDTVLGGSSALYAKVAEEYEYNLQELNYFDFANNSGALLDALRVCGFSVYLNPYGKLCTAVYKKLRGLKLDDERQLIVESRAMLTSYDDFMFGLKANKVLYDEQEQQFRQKVAQLEADYEKAKLFLLSVAQEQGVMLQLPDAPLMIGGATDVR